MRRTIIAAITAGFVLAPLAAGAQATGEKMQGSPNAAGMSKSDKTDAQAPSGQAASDKVKGPPNADGAAKADGKKD